MTSNRDPFKFTHVVTALADIAGVDRPREDAGPGALFLLRVASATVAAVDRSGVVACNFTGLEALCEDFVWPASEAATGPRDHSTAVADHAVYTDLGLSGEISDALGQVAYDIAMRLTADATICTERALVPAA